MKSRNTETDIALDFHEATKHSEISIRRSGHYLDWENKPSQFKVYEQLEKTPLPRGFPWSEAEALSAISGTRVTAQKSMGLPELAAILFFSAGITRKLTIGGEPHYMRAASATGALYPVELYVVSGKLPQLDAGVYHFDPLEFGLTRIRSGDYRRELAVASNDLVEDAPVTIVFSSLAWRNSWKYQARSYRHWYWDGGVIVANLLAVASGMDLPAGIVTGFVDHCVDRLLGLEERKEASILLVHVGKDEYASGNITSSKVGNVQPKTRPLSGQEMDYPEIWHLHEASSLRTSAEVGSWRSKRLAKHEPVKPSGKLIPIDKSSSNSRKLSAVILRRGSTRNFARSTVSFQQLSDILRVSNAHLPVDYSEGEPLLDTFFIANMVDSLPSGAYLYHPEQMSIEQLKFVESRRASMYLSLEQPLFGDASIVFFLMADLDTFLSSLGNRGYRVAQLEGGIIAGRIYLSSYALGLGASGSTFYDDAVTEFFSPGAKRKSPIIEVAVGVPGYKARSGSVLPQFKTN
jgi:SagB-type dehydrogenase family enzyme